MPNSLPFPDTLPVLRDEIVCLRALEESDIPAWFARASDIEAADLAGDPVPASVELGVPWLARQREVFRLRTAMRWAIVPKGVGEGIGTVGLTLPEPQAAEAELGIVVGRPYWGRGLGTAAVRLALRYGFEVLQLQQVRAEVLQRNPASIRLLEKSGFGFVRLQPPTPAEPEVMLQYLHVNPVQVTKPQF